jgi:hypothetical protein
MRVTMARIRNGDGDRAQRGAALLLALVLTVSLSLLAITVLAGRDLAVAVGDQAVVRERAHRAAASGVEWAAAKAMADGLAAVTTSFTLASGEQISVQIRPLASPQVLSVGTCDGAVVQLGADLTVIEAAAPPHAYASLSGTSVFSGKVAIEGSAYFGDASLPLTSLSGTLSMAGDVDLVTLVPPAPNPIQHSTGQTNYGVAALAAPTFATGAFPATGTGGVTVTDYTGSQTWLGQSLSGIVRITVSSGQVVSLESTTVNGTIVMVTTGPLGVRPKLKLLDGCTVNGGTVLTGNLAILAPDCAVESNTTTKRGLLEKSVNGVVVAHHLNLVKDVAFTGMVVTVAGMWQCTGTIDRPAGFVPDTPLGLQWAGQRNCQIQWRGVQ